MKLAILSLALLCVFPGTLSYLFGGGNAVNCRYEGWTKCQLIDGEFIVQRRPLPNQPKVCRTESKHCSRGTYVATSLRNNFLTPIASHGYGSKYPGVYACAGRQCAYRPILDILTTPAVPVTPAPTTPPPRPACTENKDRDGNLVSGNCNTNSQSANVARQKRQTPVQKKRDLLIMLDESGSVGEKAFNNLTLIAAGIVKDLCLQARVQADRTRVAVMSFDSTVHYHKRFSNYWSQANLIKNIKDIKYNKKTAGSTCMKKALDFARNTIFSSQHGARPYHYNVQQDIILITDGCANCVHGNSAAILKKASDQLIAKGINTYVLGIALGSGCQQKIKILGQGGNCEHFFYITKKDVSDVVAYMSAPHPCLPQFIFPGTC